MFSVGRNRIACRRRAHAFIKDERHNEEEAEKGQLHEETDEHDLLSHVGHALLRHHAAAAGLHEEGDDIADDEDFCDARGADDGGVGRVDEDGDAAVDHVDGCGVEGGWEDDEEGLSDVGHH